MKLPFLTSRCLCWGGGRSAGRSANCHSGPLDVSMGDRSAGRSRDRSAKFELILTTRCQYQAGVGVVVDLLADVGVDLPNLNSS